MMKNLILRIGALTVLSALLFTSSLATDNTASESQLMFADPAQGFPATANTAPTSHEMQQVHLKTNAAVRFLDTFWQRTFTAYGRNYTSPRIVASGPAAFYNRSTDTIHYNPAFFALQMRAAGMQMRTDGDFAFIVIMAHEWGHAVQQRLGVLRGRTLDRELQADCLAGAFARAAKAARVLDPGDLDEATYAFLMARDKVGTNPNDPYAHGSGEERVRAFHKGLDGGAKACGCF